LPINGYSRCFTRIIVVAGGVTIASRRLDW
jgi:hypothetical protein